MAETRNWLKARTGPTPLSRALSTITMVDGPRDSDSIFDSMNGDGRVSSAERGFGFQGSVGFLRPPLSAKSEVKFAFEENVWVRAGIKAFSEAFSRMPFEIWTGKPSEDTSTALGSHELLDLLRSPNPLQTQAEFWQAHATNMKMDGENYWFLADFTGEPVNNIDEEEGGSRSRISKMPDMIIQVRGALVEHDTNDRGVPVAYRYPISQDAESTGTAGYSPTYPASAVIPFIDYNPHSIVRGFGDVMVVQREIDLYFQAQRYLDGVIRNGGDPGAWIVFRKKTSAEEIQRRQAEMDEEYTGENASRYRVLDSDATVIPNKIGPKDMEYTTLFRELAISILAALGVPPPMVGLFEDATYNNIEVAERIMWTGPNGVLSMAHKTADAITFKFLARLGPATRDPLMAVFNFTNIEVLQKDRTPQIEAANKMVAAGTGLTMQDALEILGVEHEPLEDERDLEGFVSAELRPAKPLLEADDEKNAVQESTLNGAQIAQLVGIVEKVGLGSITKAAAIELIVAAFPLDAARANKILASVTEGSVDPPVSPGAEGGDSDSGTDSEDGGEKADGNGGDGGDSPPPEQEPIGLSVWEPVLHSVNYRAGLVVGAVVEPDEKLAKSIEQWLRKYEKATLKLWKKLAKEVKSSEAWLERGLSVGQLDLLTLSESEWTALLANSTESFLKAIFADALAVAQGTWGGPFISLSDPQAVKFLLSQQLSLAQVSQTTAARIRTLLERVFRGTAVVNVPLETLIAEKLPKLSEGLKAVFGTKEARANSIARTETGRAQNSAIYMQMGEAGVKTVRWITAGDGVVRDTHSAAAGEGAIPYNQRFGNGLLHPHDPAGSAAEVVNCRCTVVAEAFEDD